MEISATTPAVAGTDSHNEDARVSVYSVGGLGCGGFFGGPLAMAYLIYRDLTLLGRADLFSKVAMWFVPFIVFWLYCLFSFPPDLISQWTLYLPQTILWWIVARHLFAEVHRTHKVSGGLFNSKWQAVRFGFLVFLGLKLTFFVVEELKAL
ncbi:hypothetical protein LPN04_17375 [Rugamonas sp. A1-17]|nr:hypothetical protein [Rugamonas sp. A1-17]